MQYKGGKDGNHMGVFEYTISRQHWGKDIGIQLGLCLVPLSYTQSLSYTTKGSYLSLLP